LICYRVRDGAPIARTEISAARGRGAIRIRKVKSNLVEVTGLFVMFVRNGLNPADLEPLK
jgi:hypothetical protein